MAKQALGRGLGSLLGEMEVAYNLDRDNNSDILELDIRNLKLNPYQPRQYFDEEKLEELSNSIKENGMLQPIVVAKYEDDYWLIAGERRYRATKLANIDTIKAVVLDIPKDKLREMALIENIQRDDLNIIEIALSYKGLIEDCGITHEELAKKVSKSRSSVSNILRLLTLDNFVQEMIIKKKISLGHAKLLVSLEGELQKTIATTIINQNLSVRETEVLIKKFKTKIPNTNKNLSKVSFDFSPFDTIKENMSKNNLQIKVDDKYFKIKITSQEDIEKIANYFTNI